MLILIKLDFFFFFRVTEYLVLIPLTCARNCGPDFHLGMNDTHMFVLTC